MSWDADLYIRSESGEHDAYVGEWNYTHNTNGMIADALKLQTGDETPMCGGSLGKAIGPAWWDRLDGLSGADGAALLADILAGLRSAPDLFRAMNPDNGWGSYDQLVKVLQAMHDASAAQPSATWSVNG